MASSSNSRKTFDVFLSFRGLDVRDTILGHLYNALAQSGIHFYPDKEELRKGEQISPGLMKAIEDSRIAIIIFSEYYASSSRCLTELTKIMECSKVDLIVLPVFYMVEPHELRVPRKSYREAMAKHEIKSSKDLEQVKGWKKALFDAGSLAGWHLTDRMSEATAIEEIIKAVSELTMYDVFLSFRGKDVRKDFVSRLNEALAKKDINAFMDSEKLLMGQDFPPALKQAIEQSRMYVVVFSENYAESRWCLKELVQILEWKNKRKQRMLPIFYRVEPWEVRGQKQSYEKPWAKHAIDYGTHKVKKWRGALTEAANVNGITLSDGIKDDSIPSIVQEIEKMVAEIKRKLG